MKERTEQRLEVAVKQLLGSMMQLATDSGEILEEYEAEHDDAECCQSKQYIALAAGYFALCTAVNKMNDLLNSKKGKSDEEADSDR